MGMLSSKVASISRLMIFPWPNKPMDMRTIRCGNVYVGVTKGGTIYSNVCSNKLAYHEQTPWGVDLMKALGRLGVLTKEDVAEHERNVKALAVRDERQTTAYDVLTAHGRQFIKLSKAQLRTAWAAITGGDRSQSAWQMDTLYKRYGMKP